MNEFLSKNTGVSLALMIKVISGTIAVMLIYGMISLRISSVEANQQRRMDANVIANVALLKSQSNLNEKRFTEIEVETGDYAANKLIFKQMATDIREVKTFLLNKTY